MQNLNISWHGYSNHFREIMHGMIKNSDLTDVTLVCDDQKLLIAHKVVLSASSPVFQNIINNFTQNHSMIYLRGIQHQEIESLLDFMYLGVATFSQERIDEFLNVAQNLGVKEISNNTANNKKVEMLEYNDSIDDIGNWINDLGSKTAHSLDKGKNEYFDGISTNEERIFSGYNFMEDKIQSDGTMESNTKENVKQNIKQKSKLEKKSSDRKFPCDQCDNVQSSLRHLQTHVDVKHNGLRLSCNVCSQQFTGNTALKNHIQTVHEGIRHPCDQCNKQYATKRILREHIMIKHEGMRYHCSQCSYTNVHRNNLAKHMSLVHSTEVRSQPAIKLF